ncbi:MAG: phospholipase [Planctomycetes bacterium]|nr:phospholipase [Planctomycetota bacterium]
MTIAAGALQQLHRIHRQLTDLREQLARGPKQVQAGEINVKRCENEISQAKDNYCKSRIASDEKQLQLKQRELRINDLQAKLNACSSNREYQALKEQIAADKTANSVLSDEILEGLLKLDELQALINSSTENLQKAKDELQKVRDRVSSQQQGLESELARVLQELADAESALPEDFKREYQRITRVRGEQAMAQVDGEVCGGCYQLLTPQMMNDLYLLKPLFCKSCGCLLYLAEDVLNKRRK